MTIDIVTDRQVTGTVEIVAGKAVSCGVEDRTLAYYLRAALTHLHRLDNSLTFESE